MHTLKLVLTIINARIEQKLDETLNETQSRFAAKKETEDAIALLKIIIRSTLNANMYRNHRMLHIYIKL